MTLWYQMETNKDLSAYSYHCCASDHRLLYTLHTQLTLLRGLSTCLVWVLTLCVYTYSTAAQVCVCGGGGGIF